MVAVIFRKLGPYHVARLNALAREGRRPVLGVEVDPGDATYAWQSAIESADFRWRTVCAGEANASADAARLWHGLYRLLDEERPAVVAVPGWSDPAALCALAWCRARRVPAIIMADSTASDERRSWWKEAVKRRVLRQASAVLVAGSRHVTYVEGLGAPPERIATGYDVVDNDYFAQGAKEVRRDAFSWRKRLGLPKQFFLACSRFVPKKNLVQLLDAFARYREMAGKAAWDLVLLGDGPLRGEIEQQRGRLGIEEQVHLPGFRQYQELPAYYGLAGAFILPSTSDQWGLVVNEAMATGLPVLVSARCGCADDLVAEGENGFTFNPNDVEQLAARMAELASPERDRVSMGRRSLAIIDKWSLWSFVKGMQEAVGWAVADPIPQSRFFHGWILRALAWR